MFTTEESTQDAAKALVSDGRKLTVGALNEVSSRFWQRWYDSQNEVELCHVVQGSL